MTDRALYTPGSAYGARAEKASEDKWTLILTRELSHPPEKVWRALTEPEHLHEWAPFDIDGNLGTVGNTVKLTWVGTGQAFEVRVTRAEAPRVLEFGDIHWELEPSGGGTRLTLWHSIDRRFISWGAAGWHIAIDVMAQLLSGVVIGRLAGAAAMEFDGWQRLVAEYKKQFGADSPGQPPQATAKS
ncbi:MAG TPA: SRPBCC family protein [Terracidiphilus sp.]|nr:SRPBCC family protein [Terracidiphilus sp.]